MRKWTPGRMAPNWPCNETEGFRFIHLRGKRFIWIRLWQNLREVTKELVKADTSTSRHKMKFSDLLCILLFLIELPAEAGFYLRNRLPRLSTSVISILYSLIPGEQKLWENVQVMNKTHACVLSPPKHNLSSTRNPAEAKKLQTRKFKLFTRKSLSLDAHEGASASWNRALPFANTSSVTS